MSCACGVSAESWNTTRSCGHTVEAVRNNPIRIATFIFPYQELVYIHMNFSRRQAITAGIASMGAAALQAPLQAQDQQPMKLGIIGLGNRGNLAHVLTLKQLPEAKITAICDIQPELFDKINSQLPAKA